MIVAFAMERNQDISQHFGHSPMFRLITIEDGHQIATEDMVSPPHQHGLLPRLLKERGVSVVVAGGMGGSAKDLLQQSGIEPVVGIVGNVDLVLERFIKGELHSSSAVCEEHEHHNECGK